MVAVLCERMRTLLPSARVRSMADDAIEVNIVVPASVQEQMFGRLKAACREPVPVAGGTSDLVLAFGIGSGPLTEDDVRISERAESDLERAVARVRLPGVAGELAAQLERAIAEGEMVVHYQPKVHVRRQEVDSVEALIRWQHPLRGLVFPGDFIAAAEQGRTIGALTLWTIERVISDQKMLRRAGFDVRIFVNISGQLLSDTAFVEGAARLIAQSDASIGFEVTETSVIRDPSSAIANLQRFADVGIRIAIDDYGAGLSSLAYLKQLPARELKIDKLFVTQLTSSNRDPLIVRSTIDLAHALDMEVVAEGVETHAAMALLTVMGCDMVQGFLISRPVPLAALLTFLAESRHSQTTEISRVSLTHLATAWKKA